ARRFFGSSAAGDEDRRDDAAGDDDADPGPEPARGVEVRLLLHGRRLRDQRGGRRRARRGRRRPARRRRGGRRRRRRVRYGRDRRRLLRGRGLLRLLALEVLHLLDVALDLRALVRGDLLLFREILAELVDRLVGLAHLLV